jgi:hypothetical protein
LHIIGVTGYAQHGKDTLGQRLVDVHGFTRYAFADQLKSMALALNPLIGRFRLADAVEQSGWEGAKTNAEVRRFLQVLGTEGVRDHLGADSWVKALELKLKADNPARAVITDVRFPNEAAWVKANGGLMVRVKRMVLTELEPQDGFRRVNLSAFDNGLPPDHPSEANVATLPVDIELLNDGTESFGRVIDDALGDAELPNGDGITTAAEDGEPLLTTAHEAYVAEMERLVKWGRDLRPTAKRHYARLDKVPADQHIDGVGPWERYA